MTTPAIDTDLPGEIDDLDYCDSCHRYLPTSQMIYPVGPRSAPDECGDPYCVECEERWQEESLRDYYGTR